MASASAAFVVAFTAAFSGIWGDVGAWSPGFTGGGPKRKRYEEYATEEQPVEEPVQPSKPRRQIRIPKAKQVPVAYPAPLDLPVVPELAPGITLAPFVLVPPRLQPQFVAPTIAEIPVPVLPEPVIPPPAWTLYPPFDPAEEDDELVMLLHVLNS